MKNHYVPQLLLRNFTKEEYRFCDKFGNIIASVYPKDQFFKQDIYSKVLETDILAKNIEGKFSIVLKNTLLKGKLTSKLEEKRYIIHFVITMLLRNPIF